MKKAPPGSAPTFSSTPTILQASGGVLFDVNLSAHPTPSVQWFKGSTAIVDGGRYHVITQTDGLHYTLQLRIDNISEEDAGAYKVTAKNNLGESNANINLNLGGFETTGKSYISTM